MNYLDCVKKVTEKIPSLYRDLEPRSRDNSRRSSVLHVTENIYAKTLAIDISGIKRRRRVQHISRSSMPTRKTAATEREESSTSHHSNQIQNLTSERFWRIVDQLYYKSVPKVADCLPARISESSFPPPVNLKSSSLPLFRYEAPPRPMPSLTLKDPDRLAYRDIR